MPFMNLEHRTQPLISRKEFYLRQLRFALVASIIIGVSLAIGTVGYYFCGKDRGWVGAFYNASMILTGMGPGIDEPNNCEKKFGALYALFSGVVFLAAASVLMAPVV